MKRGAEDLRSPPERGLIARRCKRAADDPTSAENGEPVEQDEQLGPSIAAPRLLLSPTEAARALGISRTKFYELLSDGTVASVRVGSLRRVRAEALEVYVASLDPAGPPIRRRR
jgi:excisionase family DNA binding protein